MKAHPDKVFRYKKIGDADGVMTGESVKSQQYIRDYFIEGYEQAEKETIQRIKELLKVRIVERTERCQEDWSNRQKDRVNIRNDEDGDIILVLEKLGEE